MNRYKQLRKTVGQEVSATRVGISVASARRIERARGLPSQRPAREWRTRSDPFEGVWETEVVPLLRAEPALTATTLLLEHFGDVEPERIHDGTLRPFVELRLAQGASPTTVNRSLEVMRTILNRAARAYRDEDGRPWLERIPPLITMLPESPRPPCPISWEEQDAILRQLPGHLQRMALFAVNTGLRESNVCGLRWSWEVLVPEIDRSVFVIPPAAFKAKRPHVVILNDAAWSIVGEQRGKHSEVVFPFRGRAVKTMNNTAWQRARKAIGLPQVRIHDLLRHTYGARLRAAGVSAEDRAALLGHSTSCMTDHYASGDIGRLIGMANRVLERSGTRTILRVANG